MHQEVDGEDLVAHFSERPLRDSLARRQGPECICRHFIEQSQNTFTLINFTMFKLMFHSYARLYYPTLNVLSEN